MPELYDYPELYDALLPAGAHAPFYAELARQQAGDVLELACGTGQIAIPIAAQGLPTIGLDLSKPMLQVATQRASALGVPATFVEGDMRHFALDRRFALIVVAHNSLLHLLTNADLLATFRTVREHLAPDGLFVFDIFNPDVRRLSRPRGQRFPVMDKTLDTFGPVRVEETADYDDATQVNHATWYISTPAQRDAWVVPLVLRSIFPQELPLLLSAAGFDLVDRFGEVSRAPFAAGSRIQVCFCRPR